MKIELITQLEDYGELEVRELEGVSETKNTTVSLIEVHSRMSSKSYEQIREAIFPYITGDEHFRDNVQTVNDQFHKEMGEEKDSEYPSTVWNGFQLLFMMDWQLVYKGIRVRRMFFKRDLAELGITEENLYADAMENLKSWADRNVFPLVKNEDCYMLYCGDQLSLTGCSVLLLNEMWQGVYQIVKDSYYLLPYTRRKLFIIPEYAAKETGMVQAFAAYLKDMNELERLSDHIFYFSPSYGKPVLMNGEQIL